MTNEQRIKNMTTMELAENLVELLEYDGIVHTFSDNGYDYYDEKDKELAIQDVFDWLKSESK